jgi:glucosamine-6-phosphate deaminase
MKIIVTDNPVELGKAAGRAAARLIRDAIEKNGQANIIMATGTSQFETINQLIKENIDWSKVVMFHLDEYLGLPESSPASFRKYLKERFLEKVSPLKESHLVNGETNPLIECKRLSEIIKRNSIDVALVGIGENGHLGFNDPPADFDTNEPFIVVELEQKCRQQQFAEGWFASIEDVPDHAITMSIKQIFKSKHIICSVPESRKAIAVRDCLEESVSNLFPASILQLHKSWICFLDKSSSALLTRVNVEVEQEYIESGN